MATTSQLLRSNASALKRNYRRTVLAASALLLAAVLAYSSLLFSTRQDSLLAETRSESQQLRLSLEGTIDLVREHLFTMRRTVEYGLTQPPSITAKNIVAPLEMGSLHRDPKASVEPDLFRRDLAAASRFLVGAAATHQWNPIFQWTYYYDKGERWFLVFPKLTPAELAKSAKTDDPSEYIRFFFDADGTRPVVTIGPVNNPKREMLWTPPYQDAGGKGMMVTLLAPVYLADDYTGAVGTDVTLQGLKETLRAHAPAAGRALVVDAASNILADTGNSLNQAEGRVRLTSVFPALPSGIESINPADPGWLRYPLKGTPWFLIVEVPYGELRSQALKEQAPYLGMAALMFVVLLALGLLQIRRYSWPALQLAEHLERSDGASNPGAPDVPEVWTPIFDHVTRTSLERHRLLQQSRTQADELERRVSERTTELQAANAALQDTVASLQQTRQELVRADRMGSLGGMIAGVANELAGPLDQAAQTAKRFHAGIAAFREQQTRGLRKAELEAFVTEAEASGRQVSDDVGAALTLIGRFKQLALDQASDQARSLDLHDVVENVMAVMRPTLSLHGGAFVNRIDAGLELTMQASRLIQILNHLLADAVERVANLGTAGCIEVLAGLDSDERGESVLLTLRDNGMSVGESPQSGQIIATTLVHEIPGATLECRPSSNGSVVTLHLPRRME